MPLRQIVPRVLYFLFVFLAIAVSCNDSDDDSENDAPDDDNSSPSDDDNNDNDNDTWEPPPPLDLPSFPGDSRLRGIACGVDTFILQADGWRLLNPPLNSFDYCRSVDPDAYVLLQTGSPSDDYVYLFADGLWQDLQFNGVLGNHVMLPLVFFDRHTGFAGNYLYQSESFQRIPSLFYSDPIAPDDAVFVDGPSACIHHWHAGVETEIACAADVPVQSTPPSPGIELGIIDLKYFSLDNIWIAVGYDPGAAAFLPAHFAHWNGAEWDDVFDAPPVNWSDQYGEFQMEWQFASEDSGWAVLNCFDPFCHENGILLEFSQGTWRAVAKPQPTPPDVLDPQNCATPATDLCPQLTVPADGEVWLYCWRHRRDPRTARDYYSPYYLQIDDNGQHFWAVETEEDIRDIDIRSD